MLNNNQQNDKKSQKENQCKSNLRRETKLILKEMTRFQNENQSSNSPREEVNLYLKEKQNKNSMKSHQRENL